MPADQDPVNRYMDKSVSDQKIKDEFILDIEIS